MLAHQLEVFDGRAVVTVAGGGFHKRDDKFTADFAKLDFLLVREEAILENHLHNLPAGSNFLDYPALNPAHPSDGEALGMTLVEYGVGITVTTVFITLYVAITEPRFLRSKRERLKVSD